MEGPLLLIKGQEPNYVAFSSVKLINQSHPTLLSNPLKTSQLIYQSYVSDNNVNVWDDFITEMWIMNVTNPMCWWHDRTHEQFCAVAEPRCGWWWWWWVGEKSESGHPDRACTHDLSPSRSWCMQEDRGVSPSPETKLYLFFLQRLACVTTARKIDRSIDACFAFRCRAIESRVRDASYFTTFSACHFYSLVWSGLVLFGGQHGVVYVSLAMDLFLSQLRAKL
jgi:hypothetical protein